MTEVKKTCRFMLNDSCAKKYCSMTYKTDVNSAEKGRTAIILTSLHTNNSSGSVVNMFKPKQNRATLIRVSFCADCQLRSS